MLGNSRECLSRSGSLFYLAHRNSWYSHSVKTIDLFASDVTETIIIIIIINIPRYPFYCCACYHKRLVV